MENPRPEKVAVVAEVRKRLDESSGAILTEYRGLSVKDLATLRRSLREAGGDYKVYKNTLVRLAARDLGITDLEPLLEGPTAIAFVDGDAVPVAKTLRDFARTNPHLVLKGGLLGTKVITERDATALADLPSRDVLLARLAGGLAAPMVQFAGLLQALPRNLAYGIKALIEKGGGPNAPAAAAAAPEVGATTEAPPAEVTETAEPEAAAAPPEAPPAAEGDGDQGGEAAEETSAEVEPAPPVDGGTEELAEQPPVATANDEAAQEISVDDEPAAPAGGDTNEIAEQPPAATANDPEGA